MCFAIPVNRMVVRSFDYLRERIQSNRQVNDRWRMLWAFCALNTPTGQHVCCGDTGHRTVLDGENKDGAEHSKRSGGEARRM
jgi:hypothetical protein